MEGDFIKDFFGDFLNLKFHNKIRRKTFSSLLSIKS